ncbi:MAG: terminase small subunit [Syntrophorhabdaceae bacterium]|nr:terminase small subunit [Syntrophorhabdaceae bacterium]
MDEVHAPTMRQRIEDQGITDIKIIKEFAAIAFSNIKDYVSISEGGEVQAICLDKISKRKSAAVKKVKEHTTIKESSDGTSIFKDSRIEYELYDKMDALKYLCKLRGDEPAQKQEITYPDQIHYTPEERAMLKELAIEQAKKELAELRK